MDRQAEITFEFQTPQEKARYVRRMFDAIARRYDLMNRLMTLGRDQPWRRRTIRRAAIPQGGRVLDIAAGTADLAIASLDAKPRKVVAADFSLQMLDHANRKLRARDLDSQIVLTAADGLSLPLADNLFDAVVTGFSLRNVGNLDLFLSEMLRVTRPGGRVVCLEITQPRWPVFRKCFSWYFSRVVPKIGAWISGDSQAYSYLPHSVSIFISPEELRERMQKIGMKEVGFEKLQFGTIAIHWGVKPNGVLE
jgi:demethylmenaquinone methyltransferase/2-methoxy-6-polyprenyl-1,4-benzoquinol methylase